MAPHQVARLRLVALCVAVGCRSTIYMAVTVATLTALQAGQYAAYRPATLAAWLGLCAVPALILVPFIGPLVASRWNRVVLIGGTVVVIVVLVAKHAGADAPWLSVLGFLSLELAFFAPAVLALVFPLARAARVSPTAAGWGISVAAIFGPWLTSTLEYQAGVTLPWQVLLAVAPVGVLYRTPERSDVVSLAGGIVRPFLAGARDAFRHRRARSAVFGLWLLGFVCLTAVAALLRIETMMEYSREAAEVRLASAPNEWFQTAGWKFETAVLLGVLFTGIKRHPFRHGGFAFLAAVAAVVALLWLRFGDSSNGPLTLLGMAIGLAVSPLVSFALIWTTSREHGIVAAVLVAGICGSAVVLAVILSKLGDNPVAARLPLLHIVLAVGVIAGLGAIAVFFRPAIELGAEAFFFFMYRFRAVGPGVERLPLRGPCLVIGNHAAWFDPLFLAKVLPAPITPMMTSKFYDLPVIAWLMRHVVGTIRVPDKLVRHEAPELKEAVAALDRGECVVLFPEGYLRRKEEVPLRRFGRGIWQILRDRPTTPVFACWIEGNWGSYLSFRGGPPAKGKSLDLWRRIRIGIIGPVPVDEVNLKDHMATRTHLMQQVSEARRPLGLEPLSLPAVHEAEGDSE
jgi:1-acyl-sn-glycerol-3-phosphate acyltransferase